MRRVLICIIGDICAGKSHLATRVAKLTGFRSISIDALRREYNKKCTESGELSAWYAMRLAVGQYDQLIIESSGTSKNWPDIVDSFFDCGPAELLTIKLICNPNEALRRLRIRNAGNYAPIPFPYPIPIESAVATIHYKLPDVYADIEIDTTSLSMDAVFSRVSWDIKRLVNEVTL